MIDVLRAEVFGLSFLLQQRLTGLADAALVPIGLTSRQWLLLAVLTRRFPAPPTLTEAAAAYGSSRQNVKQLARQLEARGFLAIRPDPADARALRLHVLPTVAAVFDSPEERARQSTLFAQIFRALSDEDLGQLQALLRRWVADLADVIPLE